MTHSAMNRMRSYSQHSMRIDFDVKWIDDLPHNDGNNSHTAFAPADDTRHSFLDFAKQPSNAMKSSSHQLSSRIPWWKTFLQRARFRFMIHDRWANVLFLHWRIPTHLEATLEAHAAPFVLERYDDSVWIGLILLTEENVGPSIGRSPWTCVTHHGINVRTYVRGANDNEMGKNSDATITTPTQRGIHFASLECDDEFTSFGANFFGMPYRVAEMKRSYSTFGSDKPNDSTGVESSSSSLLPSNRYFYRIESQRLPSGRPSFFRMLFHTLNFWRPRLLHSIEKGDSSSDSTKSDMRDRNSSPSSSPLPPQRFTVDCSWSRSRSKKDGIDTQKVEDAASKAVESFEEWATERYFVYAHKYGCNWRGRVDHEPWPVETSTIQLEHLKLSGVDAYEPSKMRPILRYMADHKPDHVGFSPGVGPVVFTMLQPL